FFFFFFIQTILFLWFKFECIVLKLFGWQNGEGFRKIIKKFDKQCSCRLKMSFWPQIKLYEFAKDKTHTSYIEQCAALLTTRVIPFGTVDSKLLCEKGMNLQHVAVAVQQLDAVIAANLPFCCCPLYVYIFTNIFTFIPMSVEPRSYLANERTFLKWTRLGALIAVIGMALVTLEIEPISGIFMILAALILLIRSFYVKHFCVCMFFFAFNKQKNDWPINTKLQEYHSRNKAMVSRSAFDWEDWWTPKLLILSMLLPIGTYMGCSSHFATQTSDLILKKKKKLARIYKSYFNKNTFYQKLEPNFGGRILFFFCVSSFFFPLLSALCKLLKKIVVSNLIGQKKKKQQKKKKSLFFSSTNIPKNQYLYLTLVLHHKKQKTNNNKMAKLSSLNTFIVIVVSSVFAVLSFATTPTATKAKAESCYYCTADNCRCYSFGEPMKRTFIIIDAGRAGIVDAGRAGQAAKNRKEPTDLDNVHSLMFNNEKLKLKSNYSNLLKGLKKKRTNSREKKKVFGKYAKDTAFTLLICFQVVSILYLSQTHFQICPDDKVLSIVLLFVETSKNSLFKKKMLTNLYSRYGHILWILVFLLCLRQFLRWYLRPLWEALEDKVAVKEYSYKCTNTKTEKKFGTIWDQPTKCISFVIPAFDEAKRLHLSLDPTIKYFENRQMLSAKNDVSFDWEIIVANDGSSDETPQIVEKYMEKYGSDCVRLLTYQKNQGKGFAVQQVYFFLYDFYWTNKKKKKKRNLNQVNTRRSYISFFIFVFFFFCKGMLHARGCFIVFADADGASEVTCLNQLENKLFDVLMKQQSQQQKQNKSGKRKFENYWDWWDVPGIAIGTLFNENTSYMGKTKKRSRKDLQQKAEAERALLRNLAMWGFHACVKYVGNVHNILDTQCGFKLFTRAAVRQTFLHQRIRRWCFDPELLMLAQLQHIPIVEIPIQWKEVPGSKLSVIKATFTMFRELTIIRMCYVLGIWYTEITKKRKNTK
ncbi:dolichyl-phosphate beta-glucosyltransferase, partial [Reticulomyxa filosa]